MSVYQGAEGVVLKDEILTTEMEEVGAQETNGACFQKPYNHVLSQKQS